MPPAGRGRKIEVTANWAEWKIDCHKKHKKMVDKEEPQKNDWDSPQMLNQKGWKIKNADKNVQKVDLWKQNIFQTYTSDEWRTWKRLIVIEIASNQPKKKYFAIEFKGDHYKTTPK